VRSVAIVSDYDFGFHEGHSSTARRIFTKRTADFVPFAANQNRALAFAVNGNTRARNFVLQFESSQQV